VQVSQARTGTLHRETHAKTKVLPRETAVAICGHEEEGAGKLPTAGAIYARDRANVRSWGGVVWREACGEGTKTSREIAVYQVSPWHDRRPSPHCSTTLAPQVCASSHAVDWRYKRHCLATVSYDRIASLLYRATSSHAPTTCQLLCKNSTPSRFSDGAA
jgi:hypothetical protein